MIIHFYDQKGKPCLYTEDGKTLYVFEGQPVAYINGSDIYTFSGKYLGYLEEGNIWDQHGDTLLFTDMSRFGVGPLKPSKSLMPLKKPKSTTPLKKTKIHKSIKPLKSKKWSIFNPLSLFMMAQ